MPHIQLNAPMARRLFLAIAVTATLLPLAGCNAVKPTRDRQEDITMYDFSAAMRWNDIDKAYAFVDPKTKAEHPLTDLERERFKQVEVSGYDVMSKVEADGVIDQQIRLELINRNTQVPRSIVYSEHWKWDAELKRWWLESGLPDISPQD